jgi:hypothetical protein
LQSVTADAAESTPAARRFSLQASRHVAAFLAAQGASLTVTTCQAGSPSVPAMPAASAAWAARP